MDPILIKLEDFLMDLRNELEPKYNSLRKGRPFAPITMRTKGQLEILEKLEIFVEEKLKG